MRSPEDRVLIFLMRLWRRMPYETLGLLFGIDRDTVSKYYHETLKVFHKELVPRLLYPLSKEEIDVMTPPQVKEDLPGAIVIWDATGLKIKGKENVLLARLLYSAYHHSSEGFAVFGRWLG